MDRPVIVTAALVGILLALSEQGHAVYRCYDKEGRQVLTDRPAQLERCVRLDVPTAPLSDPKEPAPPSDAPGRADDRKESVQEQDPGAANHAVIVPLQQLGHLFVVTVKLNGEQDAQLIVDTGASHTILSHKLAGALGLYSDSPAGSVTMNTVGGAVQAPLVKVKSIRVAAAEVRDSLVVIHDLPDSPKGVEGLLGLSALGQFQVTLDPAKKILSLQPTAK